MKLKALITVLALTACAPSGQDMASLRDMLNKSCDGENEVARVDCQSNGMMEYSTAFGYGNTAQLIAYYSAKRSIAEQFDSGKITAAARDAKYASLQGKHAKAFSAPAGQITPGSAKNFTDDAMFNYLLIK